MKISLPPPWEWLSTETGYPEGLVTPSLEVLKTQLDMAWCNQA